MHTRTVVIVCLMLAFLTGVANHVQGADQAYIVGVGYWTCMNTTGYSTDRYVTDAEAWYQGFLSGLLVANDMPVRDLILGLRLAMHMTDLPLIHALAAPPSKEQAQAVAAQWLLRYCEDHVRRDNTATWVGTATIADAAQAALTAARDALILFVRLGPGQKRQ